jgi:hypothetical protein
MIPVMLSRHPNILLTLASALFAVSASGTAIAAPLPPAGTFIYSAACESSGGDFTGLRMTLIRTPEATRAVVEFNDEGPDGRDVVDNVELDPKRGTLTFTFHDAQRDAHSVRGRVTTKAFQGAFDDITVTLPAIKRIPKRLPDC